ncbi:hypothetical protein SELMODRAFT_180494 [Selaginella moellendorffii]|uniref:histone deacetylase n=1 Tax=Selaginella moellendorffii TaxID=88036 RepID=D8SKB6_SELML|nr:histone deacetylase 2 isoform X2 [Selaginella moellendorffii]EFJ15307.1 hypothetical protein SELMODRAFT_180494 [Selaginella moellendorffii]|eukprot:XP_002983811.1 histone deacetylase 2 isoform X2 [Selaginella moellendorffii]
MAKQASSSGGALYDAQRLARIKASKLYVSNASPGKVPVIYSAVYNIAFLGLEKLHPFDSSKWGRVCELLIQKGELESRRIMEPGEATKEDLLVVHTPEYLESLKRSYVAASILEVPPVALLPYCIIRSKVLVPFRKQVGGSVLAGKVAYERGWAINVGGGFHHCCGYRGGGFCVYADITLCIHFAFANLNISRAMIVDLDAHQGNGHERDFADDDRVFIFDMYNRDIYPLDYEAKRWIDRRVEISSGTRTDSYLTRLKQELEGAFQAFAPDLLVYNAGTDILEGDPLGRLEVSPEGVKERDEIVFSFARQRNIPIVMLTSGGYMRSSAGVIAESISNLHSKKLIDLAGVN